MTAVPPLPSSDRLSELDARLVARIETITEEELSARRAQLARISPESTVLVDDLAAFLQGGKLLRPRFCFWQAMRCSPNPTWSKPWISFRSPASGAFARSACGS